jgi:uncharacterized protein YndB with AHSA1/START domain
MVTVARYTINTHVGAPREHVFALWTNLERMGEWVGGVTAVSDVSGSVDQVGTTYIVHFGPVKSQTEVLEVEPPRLFSTKFGSWILRGRSSATFEPDLDGTRITQTFETVGLISAVSSWVFSRGSYEGSFRGELEKFARIAEREAPPPPG